METCLICGRYLPNDFFPRYGRYLNEVHQPCGDCWAKLTDKEKDKMVEDLDKIRDEFYEWFCKHSSKGTIKEPLNLK